MFWGPLVLKPAENIEKTHSNGNPYFNPISLAFASIWHSNQSELARNGKESEKSTPDATWKR